MTNFDVGEFLAIHDLSYLNVWKLTKAKLLKMCLYYELEVDPSANKPLLASIVVNKLSDLGAINVDDEGEETEDEPEGHLSNTKLSSDHLFELGKLKHEEKMRQFKVIK